MATTTSTVPLKVGDLVKIEAGDVGQIVYISRLTAFVQFGLEETNRKPETLRAYLLSALTLVAASPSDEADF